MKKTLVAIFEDDVVNRYIYERSFSMRQDLALSCFDQVEVGIRALTEQNYDMVFIEAHFHENFGGIKILERLKASLDHLPTCIAMTSLIQKGDLEKLMAAGFIMCLEKPIAFTDVVPKGK